MNRVTVATAAVGTPSGPRRAVSPADQPSGSETVGASCPWVPCRPCRPFRPFHRLRFFVQAVNQTSQRPLSIGRSQGARSARFPSRTILCSIFKLPEGPACRLRRWQAKYGQHASRCRTRANLHRSAARVLTFAALARLHKTGTYAIGRVVTGQDVAFASCHTRESFQLPSRGVRIACSAQLDPVHSLHCSLAVKHVPVGQRTRLCSP